MTELYKPGEANYPRLKTDSFFTDYNARICLEGILDRTIRYVEEFELLDPVLWRRFVEQFREHGDDPDRGWRGEYWGKMMRGACFTWTYTRDEKLMSLLRQTIEDMLASQDEEGRISSYSVHKEFDGWDIWSRKYVLLGMQYFMEITDDAELKSRLLASMRLQADYILSKIGREEDGKKPIVEASAHWRGLNSSSILEPIVRLYNLTGDRKYLDFATYIIETGGTSVCDVFQLAYENVADPYQYPITKAYELTSCFEGLLEYYRATGIEKWKTAVLNYAHRLMKTDVTIIGCCGCSHENLDHSSARQTDPSYTGIMQETCVTVTWMKFCWQLLLLTGDAAFADCMETSLYNAFLGAVNTEKVIDKLIPQRYPDACIEPLPFDSYSPLLPGTRGRGVGGLKMMSDNHYYGCCACIGAAGSGLVSRMATLLSGDGLAVNLYARGSITTQLPSGTGITLRMDTEYPAEGTVRITVEPEYEESFVLRLRIPAWSKTTTLTVNGESVPVTDILQGYVAHDRVWKRGDTVTLGLDMRARLIPAPFVQRDVIFTNVIWRCNYLAARVVEEPESAKDHIAILRGPLVLARDKRLDGTVDEAASAAVREDGSVKLEPSHKAGFPTLVEFRVEKEDGGSFTVVDYSSAGKTWDEDSRCCCWMPTREYWK